MKLLSFALVAGLALAGAAQAQTPDQSPANPPASNPPASSSEKGSESLGHACKKEVRKLCGRAHGDEMQTCIKENLDMKKFSADCQTKLMQSKKPSS